jgi:hypothetical protein
MLEPCSLLQHSHFPCHAHAICRILAGLLPSLERRAAIPALSIVLVTSDARRLDKVLRHYRATGDPDRLEIVVAAIAGAVVSRDSIAALGFEHIQIINVVGDIGHAEWSAVHAASAPYLVFGQIHAYPMAGFVDSILAALRAYPWTVVGPATTNANPRHAVSRAAMLIHYGPWLVSRPSGAATSVLAHNSAYQRSALLLLGEQLRDHLEAGPSLQDALHRRGATFFFESAACIATVNISRFRAFIRDQFLQGAYFAYRRRRSWSWIRRSLYLAGAPLIPFVRFIRIAFRLYRNGHLHELRCLPMLLAGLFANAAGEFSGYAVSVDFHGLRIDTTLNRLGYVLEDDRLNERDQRTWPAGPISADARR